MNRRVVITGIGWITPLGHDIESVWANMLEGKSGIGPNTLFDASTFPTSFCAQVKDYKLENILKDRAEKHKSCSRNTAFALGAATQAWESSGLDKHLALDKSRVGIYLGGGEGPINFFPFAESALAGCLKNSEVETLDTVEWAKKAFDVLDPTHELEQDPNLAAGHVAVEFGVSGPCMNTLTACAASTQALGEATNIIRYGDADVMISGGTHSMIHPLGVTGFNRLTALSNRNDSPETASRPFDRTRDGFVLGEGSGILILEELEHAQNRGATILAEIVGYGSTADAFRITDIHEDGRGAIAAMNAALNNANLTKDQINYISAHGTGTEENDKIETLAIKSFFEDHAANIPVSSIKSMIGHLIAAAGAVELITCVLAIRDGMIPPTINYENEDPRCDLDYVPNQSRKAEVNVAISNSFGFGGQNDTLAVQKFTN